MSHKPGPEQAVGVNEGQAVAVSLQSELKEAPISGWRDPRSLSLPSGLGWAGGCSGPWQARQSPASSQAAEPGALLLNFTIHMLNFQFSSALAKPGSPSSPERPSAAPTLWKLLSADKNFIILAPNAIKSIIYRAVYKVFL